MAQRSGFNHRWDPLTSASRSLPAALPVKPTLHATNFRRVRYPPLSLLSNPCLGAARWYLDAAAGLKTDSYAEIRKYVLLTVVVT